MPVAWTREQVINFFLAYRQPDTNELITDRRKIRIQYLKTWFTIDLVSVLPFDSLGTATEGGQDLAQLKVPVHCSPVRRTPTIACVVRIAGRLPSTSASDRRRDADTRCRDARCAMHDEGGEQPWVGMP